MSTKQPLEFHKFEVALENAQQAFWAAVVEQYPEVSSGDFGPEETAAFDTACTDAIVSWLQNNYPNIYKTNTQEFLKYLVDDLKNEFPDLTNNPRSKQSEWIALIELHQSHLEAEAKYTSIEEYLHG